MYIFIISHFLSPVIRKNSFFLSFCNIYIKSPPTAYCFSQLKQGTYLIRLKSRCISFLSYTAACQFLLFIFYFLLIFYYTNAAPKALHASVASSSGSSWQITLSHTRFAPASLQDSSQLRIHSPSPHP